MDTTFESTINALACELEQLEKEIEEDAIGQNYTGLDSPVIAKSKQMGSQMKGNSDKINNFIPHQLSTTARINLFNRPRYATCLNKVQQIVKKFSDNKYIRIAGFTVNLGLVPSISITCEFKEDVELTSSSQAGGSEDIQLNLGSDQ